MAEISAKLVKELREKTGAGMMDCKKALSENDGDINKAVEWLRQKGITSAEKKAGRTAAEGLIGSYIHTGSRIGVLVEVNCETDFVARRDEFKNLVKMVAMQIAACPNVEYVKVEDIPASIIEKEKEIEMGREDLANKPENIREKIVQGRIEKRMKELSLLDQPYIQDQNKTVEELIKENVGVIGENIQVRRFVRFVLGEGIEKEESNFAEEVAAQMGQKPVEEPKTEEKAAEPEPAPEPKAKAEEKAAEPKPVSEPKAKAEEKAAEPKPASEPKAKAASSGKGKKKK